jgi:outer membrane usher protein
VSAAGALVGIGGGLFATRPVRSSFALVQVPGVKDVRGFSSNREVGRTDRRGNVLVPDLLPYYGNLLNISDTDVPIDYLISRVQATIAPPYRGGVLVRFPVARIQRSQGQVVVVDAGGERPATYGQLTVTAAGERLVSPLGAAGQFYFENLAPGRHAATVEFTGGTCDLTLEVPEAEDGAVDLGVVRCVPGATR